MNNRKLNTHLSQSDIGQIQRSDQSIRRHTHKVMKYLVKDGQHLRLKPAGARCLRKGTLGRYRRFRYWRARSLQVGLARGLRFSRKLSDASVLRLLVTMALW
ncbi:MULTISPECIES: hypothetical protein [unclassified Pseudomonas]|uniref:hypothetical protein n=1 Tax=unclassified Pseudomonas TaxID=196821 RepID=UPI0009DF2037|nr:MULTISPECIES: hypothetical protein [unclassified Pseudomonas]